MEKYLMIWPKSSTVRHINYHFTQFGEIVDYLNNIFNDEILAIDYDILNIDLNQLFKMIIPFDIKFAAFCVTTENFANSCTLVNYIKKIYSNISIIAYGPMTELAPYMFLNTNFDAIYYDGDPELCIKSFFDYYNIDNSNLIGMKIIKDKKFINTSKGKYINSNDWGLTKTNIIPVDEYSKIKKTDRFVINISRGCPFGCKHCLVGITEGHVERRRSIDNLYEALKYIYPKYKHIKLWAANFTLNKKYVYDFCNLIKIYFKDLTWECATRIDLINDDELIDTMAKNGCTQISFGIETINNESWITAHKSYSFNEIKNVINKLQKANIKIKACIMIGIPEQTKESIFNTIDFLTENNIDIRPTLFTPYHLINEQTPINTIDDYNRKTFYNDVDGISYRQALSLLYNIKNYRNILGM